MKKRAWAKRVPKQNINYLHYNYINFFTTTTTTTATILCVMDQRLLWCEHCKRTFFERLRCLVPLLWNLTSRCEIEKLCHFQEREREKRKSVVHIATLLVFLNSSINFVWYYQSEKVHRSSSCHDFSLLVIRSSHPLHNSSQKHTCPTSTTYYQVFYILNSFEETPQVIIFSLAKHWTYIKKTWHTSNRQLLVILVGWMRVQFFSLMASVICWGFTNWCLSSVYQEIEV